MGADPGRHDLASACSHLLPLIQKAQLGQEHDMKPEPPTSSDSRFNEEGDWIAQHFFAPEDLRLSPEEYVARHAHADPLPLLTPWRAQRPPEMSNTVPVT